MSKARILVVDDEIYVLHILDFSLSMEGFEVQTAMSGEEALQKVKEWKPDLIVLDIMMIGMDGYEVCRTLKADPATKSIKVILMSSNGRKADQQTVADAGADDCIGKPFGPPQLIKKVNNLLGLSGLKAAVLD